MRGARWLLALTLVLWGAAWARADDLPVGWSAAVSESFDRAPFGVSGPPEAVLRRDYPQFSLKVCADARVAGASARWQVRAAKGTTEAPLVLRAPAAADGVALWVKNPLLHPVQLSLRLTDARGRTFRSQPRGLSLQKGWFRYVFTLDEFLSSDPAPELPYRTAELLLGGLEADREYTLYLDELCLLQAPPPQLKVLELTAPVSATAGALARVQMRLQPSPDVLRPIPLVLTLERAGMSVAIREVSLTPRQASCEAQFPLPRHIAGGAYQLKLAARGAELTGGLSRDLSLQAEPAPKAIEVRPPSQGGCFAVDGVGLPIIGGWWRADALPRQVPWLMLPLTSDFDFDGRSAPVWQGPDRFDYTQTHERLARALGANPDAYLLPVVAVSSPPWWDEQHPGDLMVFGDGAKQLPAGVAAAKRTFASWASAAWRRDAGAALTRLVQHLENSPWGPAIIGYQLASGEDGRWVYPGATSGVFADYSGPQQEAFRGWLKGKYKDVTTLRVAWGQPRRPVTTAEALKQFRPILGWSDARVPAMARRAQPPGGALIDPNAAQDVADYQIFCSDLVAETIAELTRQVRNVIGRKKLVGVAYGQLFDLAATRSGLQNGGHLALTPVCADDNLDFIVSPGAFGESANPPLMTTVTASLAQHGKLWVAQGDAARAGVTVAAAATAGGVAAVEAPPQAAWLERLAALPPTMPRSGPAEVAVVVDDISAAYTGCGPDLVKPLLSDQRFALSLLGAPADVWMLDDVLSGVALGYKLYIFLDAFYLDAKARQQLVGALSQQPCTALWIYAPGALDADMNLRTIKHLTGLTLFRPMHEIPGAKPVEDGPAPRTDKGPLQVKIGGAEGFTYGTPTAVSPRFACWDERADIRGTLVGTPHGGFAVAERDGVKSVWSAAPHLPASLLRSIAMDADVHLFSPTGAGIYANKNLLAVRASADGDQRVLLPRVAAVYDLQTGQVLGPAANEFTARMKAGEIRLYYWGTAPLATP